jgi:Na+-transporting NADH:ubiquinone oxidoreductase subunit C
MKIESKAWYPVVYMFVITLFFTAILILFGSFTRERVENNEQIQFEQAVLEALPIDLTEDKSPADIHARFISNIRDPDIQSAEAYQYIIDDSLVAYALPVAGPGFWAPVEGVIGISVDQQTITGIAFYAQEETPGLGGEIANPPFRNQFENINMKINGTPIEFRMPTEELDEHSVHTITGATQTSQRVGKFINAQLIEWQRAMGSRE